MKCQVVVEQGQFPKHGIVSDPAHLTPLTAEEIEFGLDQRSDGRRLACAAEVIGDLLINVPEESQARKQIIAKAASDRVIDIDPAIRQLFVQLTPPELGESLGDWERLSKALQEQWDLGEIGIDVRVLPDLQAVLRQGDYSVTVTLWQDREVLRVEPGYQEGAYGLAVDVGSTTVVAHLCDLRTGDVLSTQASMNSQVRYGEDLMSRVSYATADPPGLARLNRAVIRTLNELAEKAAVAVGLTVDDILEAVIVGNPVMHHILLGIDPVELGGAPFAPAVDSALDIKARDIGLSLHPAARLHLLPLIAGHVGADNVAVQIAETPYDQDQNVLIVDVGTNAEIVLGNRQRVLVASSPTGPAFEGAQITHGQRAAPGAVERVRIDPNTFEPRIRLIGFDEWIVPGEAGELLPERRATGICGSGIIEVIAEMYLAGMIDSGGLFVDSLADRTPRIRYRGRTAEYVLVDENLTASGSEIVVTQNDIRSIQLAIAAVYAGTKLLMAHLGLEKVDRVVLAGAFGNFISPLHAMVLGLIPDCELDKVVAVGNAAGDGARFALLNRGLREKAAWLAGWVEHISTPLESSFQDQFVAALNIPHLSDPFPHLESILPEPGNENNDGRRGKTRLRDRLRTK
jgi:uncharacterized 2Fe-2S/4Fe-4S cluster protein (DUF4445 family)